MKNQILTLAQSKSFSDFCNESYIKFITDFSINLTARRTKEKRSRNKSTSFSIPIASTIVSTLSIFLLSLSSKYLFIYDYSAFTMDCASLSILLCFSLKFYLVILPSKIVIIFSWCFSSTNISNFIIGSVIRNINDFIISISHINFHIILLSSRAQNEFYNS